MSESLKYDFTAIRISTATDVVGFVHLGPFSEWGYTIWIMERGKQFLDTGKCLTGVLNKEWNREDAYTAMKAVFDQITQASRVERLQQEKEDIAESVQKAVENAR